MADAPPLTPEFEAFKFDWVFVFAEVWPALAPVEVADAELALLIPTLLDWDVPAWLLADA